MSINKCLATALSGASSVNGVTLANIEKINSIERISLIDPTNLYLFYDLVGGSGATVTDQGTGGNDGTLVGSPTWETDGVDFNGITQYITIGVTLQSILRGSFTIFIVVKPDDGFPVSQEAIVGTTDTSDYLNILLDTGGEVLINFDSGTMGGAPDIQVNVGQASTGFINGAQSAFTSITYVMEKNVEHRAYINGTSVSYQSLVGYGSTQEGITPSNNTLIGAYTGVASHFAGRISKILIYETNQSGANISALDSLYR